MHVTAAPPETPPEASPPQKAKSALEPRDLLEIAEADRLEDVAVEVEEFYDARDRKLAWLDAASEPHVQRRARHVIRTLRQASRHGLDPQHYRIGELESRLAHVEEGAPGHRALYELDAELTAALLHYGSHLLRGRVSPEDVNRQWFTEPRQADLSKSLGRALATDDAVRSFLADVVPPHEEYRDLVEALDHLRTISEQGGWPEVPDGPTLEAGESADPERLLTLARRLHVSGDLKEIPQDLQAASPRPPLEPAKAKETGESGASGDSSEASESPALTSELAQALRRFQRRHGIRVDGILGPNAMAALNVPVEEKIEQVRMNLERWRWLPADFGSRYVYVNTADQKLETYDGDTRRNRMAVVVGKEGWHTPVFSDEMERVVFHPFWNVPDSIVRRDLLPKVRENPSYLGDNGYEVLSGWGSDAQRIDPSTIDWSSVDLSNFRVRQRPGPGNALGQIKFLFPNRFNVYLHDTPAQHLFDEPDRARSHGCVRVEKPVELAGFVFAETEGWNQRKARVVLQRPKPFRQVVELDRKLPVYMLYWTVFRDREGRWHFLEDVYGHDEALLRALDRWRGNLPEGHTAGRRPRTAKS